MRKIKPKRRLEGDSKQALTERRIVMFWDKVSPLYDFFETVYNSKVYRNTGKRVAAYISEEDTVLECACGTGAISEPIAQKCRLLIATDMAEGMLRQTYRKCSKYGNVKVRRADLTHIKWLI